MFRWLAACALLWGTNAAAYDLYVPSELPNLKAGFEMVYNEQYPEAEKVFAAYIKKYPDRPDGYFYMTGRYAEYMNASHDRSLMGEYEKWAVRTMQAAEAYSKAHPGDPTGDFYAGNIHGYSGLLAAQEQNLVSAFLNAVKAKRHLEKSLELDPASYDSYFGLGSLYYYASRKHMEEGGMVGWIVKKFITHDADMRHEGIEMLRKAITNGGISADSAYSALVWILIIEKQYDEAMVMGVEMQRRWPRDKHGYWAQGRIHLLRGECGKARERFEQIAALIKADGFDTSRFPEVGVAVDLSTLCLEAPNLKRAELRAKVSSLRSRMNPGLNMQIEYANSKGVVKDFSAMLTAMEKQQVIFQGNGHK